MGLHHHRLRGHCIAKGVDIAGLVAELIGKALGSCKCCCSMHIADGSMQMADADTGMLGTTDIGTLAAKRSPSPRVDQHRGFTTARLRR